MEKGLISIPSENIPSNPNNHTFSIWLKPSTVAASTLISYRDGNANPYNIKINDSTGYIRFDRSFGGDREWWTTTTLKVDNTNWHHIVVIFNDTDAQIYVNGTSETPTKQSQTEGSGFAGTNTITLAEDYNGLIDELLIFNRTLTATEVGSLYNATATQYSNNFTNLADNTNYTFTGYAVDQSGNRNQTEQREVTVNIVSGIAIDLSSKLASQINWTITTSDIFNQSAEGNNGNDTTDYFVNISVESGTADIYIRANSDLITSDLDILGLGNETLSYNTTNSSVPSQQKFALTTNFADNKIGNSLGDGSTVYLKFFIDIPIAQPAGTYNNSLEIKAVPVGQDP